MEDVVRSSSECIYMNTNTSQTPAIYKSYVCVVFWKRWTGTVSIFEWFVSIWTRLPDVVVVVVENFSGRGMEYLSRTVSTWMWLSARNDCDDGSVSTHICRITVNEYIHAFYIERVARSTILYTSPHVEGSLSSKVYTFIFILFYSRSGGDPIVSLLNLNDPREHFFSAQSI